MEDQLKNAAEQAKAKAQELASEAQETFQELKEEITEKIQSVDVEGLKAQAAAKAEAGQGKPKDIDKKQAEAILQSMANEEKSLRDALKERMKESFRNQEVEKDW